MNSVSKQLRLENPGSIVERLKRDAEPKEYLFQFPGVAGALKPWYDLKADLDQKHGFTVGMSFTTFYQKANDTFGPEDAAASYDRDISGTWTDPANHELDDQSQIDTYYRVQVTPEIQIGPTFQVIFDPVRNPEEDTVYVWGIRSRIEL